MIPLQVVWLGVSQRHANANSLVAIIPISIAALPVYLFVQARPQVDLHFAFFLIIGSVVGAYVGARLLNQVPDRELKLVVGGLMLAAGLKELVLP